MDESKETPKLETGISLEELTKIASEINSTPPDNRGGLTRAEYGWLYTPGEKLQILKNQTSHAAQILMLENAFVMEEFKNTEAAAVIHNHPGGTINPSLEDINVLLRAVADNSKLEYALIAVTNTGKVSGFYEMQFLGDRSKARNLMRKNMDLYREHIRKKMDWLDDHPEVRDKMRLGDNILSKDDYAKLVKEAMTKSSVVGRVKPLRGFRAERGRFVPDTR